MKKVYATLIAICELSYPLTKCFFKILICFSNVKSWTDVEYEELFSDISPLKYGEFGKK